MIEETSRLVALLFSFNTPTKFGRATKGKQNIWSTIRSQGEDTARRDQRACVFVLITKFICPNCKIFGLQEEAREKT